MLLDDVIAVVGPPRSDSITNEPLEEEQVFVGMKKEMDSFENLKALCKATFKEAEGHKLIGLRWVLRKKRDLVKARLVAQEVNTGTWVDA